MKYGTAAGLIMAASLAFSQNVTPSDKKFVNAAAEGGLAEVELGKLAAGKAENADVKAFGQRMVDDHSKANDSLKQVASGKGITLPSALNARDKAEMNKLSGLSGAAFDRAYMRLMVTDHKKDVAEFDRASRTAKDGDIKKFAADTLPTLKDHLQQAEKVSSSLHGTAPAAEHKGKKKK